MARVFESATFKVGLLITAAGLSTRMGGSLKKEYHHMDDRPVIVHTLLAFLRSFSPEEIVVTVPSGDEQRVEKMLSESVREEWDSVGEILRIVAGGESRRESVFNGLRAFRRNPDYVLIHDGARPWVDRNLITTILRDCIAHEASIPVIPITDAVKRITFEGYIDEHLSRSSAMGAQTPQAFSYSAILEAHREAAEDGHVYIDDSEIFSRYKGPVHTVAGDPNNIKITFPEDIHSYRRGKE